MGFWRVLIVLVGWISLGHCFEDLWLIEQDFVKFGKKEAYEAYKKDLQKDFVRNIGAAQYCIEDAESSQFIYLIAVRDFKGLSTLMEKRMKFHERMEQGDEKQILPFLSTVNFFIESVHRILPECSYVPANKGSLVSFPAVYYKVYGIVPGNGPVFEDRLKLLAEAQAQSENPICFRTWRVLFAAEVPSYVVVVFADSMKEAKRLEEKLQVIDGQMKNIVRQERKGSGVFRKDLSAM